jgi:hypothetical protein
MIPAKEIDGELWIKASDHHQAIKEALAQPAQRPWVGLTDEERQDIALEVPMDAVCITETKLRSKNEH